jgi:hypothetical protein
VQQFSTCSRWPRYGRDMAEPPAARAVRAKRTAGCRGPAPRMGRTWSGSTARRARHPAERAQGCMQCARSASGAHALRMRCASGAHFAVRTQRAHERALTSSARRVRASPTRSSR